MLILSERRPDAGRNFHLCVKVNGGAREGSLNVTAEQVE